MGKPLLEKDVEWLLALGNARVKKQRRRIENLEDRKGDDSDHHDLLTFNLTWMEDAMERVTAVLQDALAERTE